MLPCLFLDGFATGALVTIALPGRGVLRAGTSALPRACRPRKRPAMYPASTGSERDVATWETAPRQASTDSHVDPRAKLVRVMIMDMSMDMQGIIGGMHGAYFGIGAIRHLRIF